MGFLRLSKIPNTIANQWPFLLALLLGLYFFTFKIIGLDLSFLPGDLADTRFNIYILEHFYQYFIKGTVPSDSYWDAPFMFPQESTISFSDNLLGTAFLFSLFRLFGQDIYTSFQLWFITLSILNFSFSYLFFNKLLSNKYASALGAFVFAFSIALIDQYVHAQTFPRFPIPIAFYYAICFYRTLNIKHFFLTVFFVVYQFYCALYLGFMLFIPISLILILSVLSRIKALIEVVNIKWISGFLGSLLLNLVLILPLALPYYNSPAMIKEEGEKILHSYELISHSVPKIDSYFFVFYDTLLWKFLSPLNLNFKSWWNHQLFPGGMVLICIAFLILFFIKKYANSKKRLSIKLYHIFFLTALITFLLFLRIGEFSFYKYLITLPGFGSMKAIQRIINIELLFFGFILAYTFIILLNKSKQALGFLIFMPLLVADNYILPYSYKKFELEASKNRVEKLKDQINKNSSDLILSYQPEVLLDNKSYYHLDAMLLAQELGAKTLNGYTSTVPLGYYQYAENLSPEGKNIWFKKREIDLKTTVIGLELDPEIKRIILKIKSHKDWVEKIRIKALKKNVPLERAIIEDAKWIAENE